MGHQITQHEVLVYEAVRTASGWSTARDVGAASGVAYRTARHHCRRLSDLGLFESRPLWGGYRYRIAPEPTPAGSRRAQELEAAKPILGIAA